LTGAQRRVQVSLDKWVKHCMNLVDPRFRKDINFIFVAYNVMQKNQIFHNTYLKTKQTIFAHITDLLQSGTIKDVNDVLRSIDDRNFVVDAETKQ
jgi:hypothetical protein